MSNAALQVTAGLVVIGLLAFMTTIGPDAGNVAIAVILALWLMWAIRNVSSLQALQSKLGA